jgi:hypothetical protein
MVQQHRQPVFLTGREMARYRLPAFTGTGPTGRQRR